MAFAPFKWKNKGEASPTPLNRQNLNAAEEALVAAITAGEVPLPSSVVSGSNKVFALDPELLISGAITRDANDAATSAPVVWPDGATGVYTATTVSTNFPGAVDAYTVTHVAGEVSHTYTQAAVTRDANGAVTNRPAITVV